MEEHLAEEVRKYPVLYDKGNVFFKDRNKKNLAWSDFASTVGLSDSKNCFSNVVFKYNVF